MVTPFKAPDGPTASEIVLQDIIRQTDDYFDNKIDVRELTLEVVPGELERTTVFMAPVAFGMPGNAPTPTNDTLFEPTAFDSGFAAMVYYKVEPSLIGKADFSMAPAREFMEKFFLFIRGRSFENSGLVYGVSASLVRPEGGLVGGFVVWQMAWRVSVHPGDEELPVDLWPELRGNQEDLHSVNLTIEVNDVDDPDSPIQFG